MMIIVPLQSGGRAMSADDFVVNREDPFLDIRRK
jgi:hypothetical protein